MASTLKEAVHSLLPRYGRLIAEQMNTRDAPTGALRVGWALHQRKVYALMIDIQYVTDFGDHAVVVPLAAAIALIFALSGWRRGALAWMAAIGGTLGLAVFAKLSFLACGYLMPEAHLRSPSGHTATAAAVYGGLIAMVVRSVWDNKRWTFPCSFAIAVCVAIIFGASRVILDVHSFAEVLVGGTIGIGGAISFVALAGTPVRDVRMLRIMAIGLLIVILLHGLHMPAEAAVESIAHRLWPFSECAKDSEQPGWQTGYEGHGRT
jgi:membrane-associated phospholipid phosphatase